MDLSAGISRSLESITGTLVPDYGTYRSLTPNDTPESSKDSGASEPTSDIAENAALDIGLSFQPLDNDLLYDLNNINMENFESPDYSMFANDSAMFAPDLMKEDLYTSFLADQALYTEM
jgi:hypothetical protein